MKVNKWGSLFISLNLILFWKININFFRQKDPKIFLMRNYNEFIFSGTDNKNNLFSFVWTKFWLKTKIL